MRIRRLVVTGASLSLLAGVIVAPPALAAGPGAFTTPTLVYANEDSSVLAANLDGSGVRPLLTATDTATSSTAYFFPKVSPDGSRVAATQLTDNGQSLTSRLVVLDLATGARATSQAFAPVGGMLPRWSTDGRFVYSTSVNFETSASSIWRLPASGGTAVKVVDRLLLDDIAPSGQQWLVISGMSEQSEGTLAVRDATTGTVNPVPGTLTSGEVRWSPDGGQLAGVDATGGIVVMPARGGAGRVVLAGSGANGLAWLPDQSGVVAELKNSIERVDLATGTRTLLVTVPGDGSSGVDVWAPTRAPDATVPAAVTVSKVSRSAAAVALSWTNPTDSDWSRTVVRRGSAIVAAGRLTSATLAVPAGTPLALTVTAYDGYGNASPLVTVTAAGVSAPVLASSVGTTGVFPVSWSAPGASGYLVRWSTMTRSSSDAWVLAPWKVWTLPAGTTSAVFGAGNLPVTVVPGVTYWLAVTPLGVTPTGATVTSTTVPYDQTVMRGSTGWTTVASRSYYLGSASVARTAGAYRTAALPGRSLTLVGATCPTCGQARIYLDGKLVRTIDTRTTTAKYRVPLWTSPTYSTVGTHTVKVVVVGTRGHPAVILDGLAAQR